MGTRSVVGYYTDGGDFRGSYVHYDGYPDVMIPELELLHEIRGYEGMIEWVEEGIKGAGRTSVTSNPYYDSPGGYVNGLYDEEYGYIITRNGVDWVDCH